MIENCDQLAAFVKYALKYKVSCRGFHPVLGRCWNIAEGMQSKMISSFATKHGWLVEIHEPGAYGFVADFSLLPNG